MNNLKYKLLIFQPFQNLNNQYFNLLGQEKGFDSTIIVGRKNSEIISKEHVFSDFLNHNELAITLIPNFIFNELENLNKNDILCFSKGIIFQKQTFKIFQKIMKLNFHLYQVMKIQTITMFYIKLQKLLVLKKQKKIQNFIKKKILVQNG